jgi:hypothetical protein
MSISEFLKKLKTDDSTVSFQETIAVIDGNYQFTPTAFSNGNQINKVGENNGSCKIFAFAKLNQLNQLQTLSCFGSYYFDAVLKNPQGIDHQNIRNFMENGWDGIGYENQALRENSVQ